MNDRTAVVKSGENMWRGDSIQIRIDQAGAAAPQPLESDLEFGVAVDPAGKVLTYNWSNSSELSPDEAQFSGYRDETGYFVAGKLDWKVLSKIGYPEKRFYTFSMLINDATPEGGRDVYFLTPGIHDGKFSNEFFKVLLPEKRPWEAYFRTRRLPRRSFPVNCSAPVWTIRRCVPSSPTARGRRMNLNLRANLLLRSVRWQPSIIVCR